MSALSLFCIGLIIAIIIISYLLVKARTAITRLTNKYSSIIDIEEQRTKTQKEIESLTLEKGAFLEKKNRLTAEYNAAHNVFLKLQKEISFLEESMEMIEIGIYKPHFNFDTPDEYKRQLDSLKELEKEMIRSDSAVKCAAEWTVEGSKAKGQRMTKQNHKLMLRAFNGECDAALAKVRWDNILKMEERVKKAFDVINKSGEVNRSYITNEFLDLKIKELRLAYELQEKIYQEKEEQRQIREQMRDEERAQREIAKAKEDAEKEEARFSKALEKAREETQKASGEKLTKLNDKIAQLEAQVKAAQELKERAISRAQITKSGHVYIISNIGSFGENIYKIGMTRRLEPVERVKELGDASVPFSYDIHAMIYTDNAPELENKIHKHFETRRLNLINQRREFFAVSLEEIEKLVKEENLDFHLTKLVEAREYRETLAIRSKGEESVKKAVEENIPESIDNLFSDDDLAAAI
ncbi:MAG: DUF4041 domain-containing protein [Deltaproteobacteria bacterium HGW-Deltaproteobacteria-12]|jgi:hypothetical protein|nr:MAG: DUF4041 domain-containing protein [Deltaproteobacteria bacterium HGW-Deltaproteobacteria-12]